MEENFLLLFRKDNPLESSVDFMKVWKQFDKDCSGYIEADELKQFIKTLITAQKGNKVTEEKLIEYTDTIVCKEVSFKEKYEFVYFIVAYFRYKWRWKVTI